ncbi:MAG: glycosyltransferase family 39 protein [Crocinitomicaceae bacterium]|nr:glycosyltransferase family 39 protein [Crocinitomicaceae bacterium]
MSHFLDKIANNQKQSILFLLILSATFFVGLGNVHLFDWDEINFAESAREMIASNDYLRVQINYSPFWEKPPFFFWLQVGSMKLFGINEFAARFPNALFGFIYLVSFYLIGKKHFSGKFGLLWALLFFGSLLPHLYFKSGIIDPVFNYFIFMSIYFMMLVISGDHQKKGQLALISGLFSGLSVITKGPVGFLLLGLTLFIYLMIKRFKPFPKFKYILFFFLGFVIILSGWLSMEVYQNGFDILMQFIAYQVELFNSPVAGHEQPFYYHFVVVFFGCFPISVLALPMLFKRKIDIPFDMRTWMLCLFWVVMILFSLTTTKIIHYSSMAYAPLSFLAVLTVYKAYKGEFEIKKSLRIAFLSVGLLVGLALMAVPVILMNKESLYPYMNDPFAVASLRTAVDWSGIELIGGIIFIIGVITAFVFMRKKMLGNAVKTIAATMAVTLLCVQFLILPKIESFTQGPAIAFYKELKGQDCYVESYGFKSYAQYYYFEEPYGLSENRKTQSWLLTGEIDKPVYMVSKITNTELDSHQNFKKIKSEGGFNFYRRTP